MAMTHKTQIFTGLLAGLVLLTAGCVPGRDFSQEAPVEDTAADISANAHSSSTGSGASVIVAPTPPPIAPVEAGEVPFNP